MLGGGGELDVLGGQVDDAVVGVAVVVAAGRRVCVIVGTDPSLGVDSAPEGGFDRESLLPGDFDPPFDEIVLGTEGNAKQVLAWRDLLCNSAVMCLVLMVAAVSAVVGPEIGGSWCRRCR